MLEGIAMRYRLRHLDHDIELNAGEFVVGRSSECQLAFDDALISRRHACCVTSEGGVTVEDLQSRNGVLVNGERITTRVNLQHGATIRIGGQELMLAVLGAADVEVDGEGRASSLLRTLPRVSETVDDPLGLSAAFSEEPSTVRRAETLHMLLGVAEKAFAMGRSSLAEGMLSGPLTEFFEARRGGQRALPAALEDAARLCAKLATVTGKGMWADRAIELYAQDARLCPAVVLDELHNAVRRVDLIDVTRLRAYVETMRGPLSSYGPADRFLLLRLEGLERLAVLR